MAETFRGRLALIGAWLAAAGVLTVETVRAHDAANFAIDFRPVYFAAKNLRVNGNPYLQVHGQNTFVYPPSCALLFAPITYVGDHAAAFGGMLLAAAGVALVAMAAGRLATGRTFGVVSAAAVFVLAMCDLGWQTIAVGNLSAIAAAGLAWSLVLVDGEFWIVAGLLFGLAASVKPLIAPAVLVFVLARHWRALAAAVGVPIALNLAALPLLAHPGDFVHRTIPSLIKGDTLQLRYNVSIAAFGQRHDIPSLVTGIARVAVAAVGVAVIVMACRAGVRWRLLAVATIPVTLLCLVARIDESHYSLAMVPLVVVLAVAVRSWTVRILAVLALCLLAIRSAPGELVTLGQLLVIIVTGTAIRVGAGRPN